MVLYKREVGVNMTPILCKKCGTQMMDSGCIGEICFKAYCPQCQPEIHKKVMEQQ